MTYEQIQKKLKNIVSERFNIPESDINDDTDFYADLKSDSLDAVEIVMATENSFGIHISEIEAETIYTFGNLIDIVCDKKNIPHPQHKKIAPVSKQPTVQNISTLQNTKMRLRNFFKRNKALTK